MSMVRSLSTYARFATAAGVEIPPNLTEAVSQMATPTIAQIGIPGQAGAR